MFKPKIMSAGTACMDEETLGSSPPHFLWDINKTSDIDQCVRKELEC